MTDPLLFRQVKDEVRRATQAKLESKAQRMLSPLARYLDQLGDA